jgi:hypothetical protein
MNVFTGCIAWLNRTTNDGRLLNTNAVELGKLTPLVRIDPYEIVGIVTTGPFYLEPFSQTSVRMVIVSGVTTLPLGDYGVGIEIGPKFQPSQPARWDLLVWDDCWVDRIVVYPHDGMSKPAWDGVGIQVIAP